MNKIYELNSLKTDSESRSTNDDDDSDSKLK